MNLADTSTFQQAVRLAQSGQKEAAYGQFSSLARINSNYTDPDLLLWIAYATPHREEAQQALNSVATIAPNHPGLPEARNRHFQREAFLVPQNRPMFHCPYCHTTVLPRIERKVSTAGWVVFTLLLLCTIIFCWIGLFIKEDYRVCSQCGMKLG
jgi:LITAF-like zinc ribbon domain